MCLNKSRITVSSVLGDSVQLTLKTALARPGARLLALGMLVVTTLAVAIPSFTLAALDTPQILSYQGRLTDAQKITVADGSKTMKFAIYDASSGGTCVWSAGNTDANAATIDCPANVPAGTLSITVTDGLFNVLLGDTTGGLQNSLPDSLFNTTSPRYLEITINGETLTPRRRLVSSATALQAGNASLLDGFDTSQVGGSSAFVPVTDSSGNLTLTKNFTVDTNTLFVDSSANRVGIGTVSPATNFEVAGNINGDVGTIISNPNTGNVAQSYLGLQNNVGTGYLIQAGSGVTDPDFVGYTNRLALLSYGTDGVSLIARNNGGNSDLRFYTGGSGTSAANDTFRRMTITSAGNVGIGAASPSDKLEVTNGSGNSYKFRFLADGGGGETRTMLNLTADSGPVVNGYLQCLPSTYGAIRNSTCSFDSDAVNGINIGTLSAAPITFYTGGDLSGFERMKITSAGSVGIGDTTPASLFTVGSGDLFQVDSSGRVFAPNGASGAGNLAYSFVNDTDTGLYRSAVNEMRLQTNGADRITVDASGNVGVGTTAPGAKLQVTSTAAGTAAQIIRGAASQSANLTSWQNSSGTTLAYVDSSGNFTTGVDFLAATTASLGTGYTVTALTDTTIPFRIMEIVIPSDNNPVIGWIDTSGNLKVAKCTATDCSTTSATTTLDTGAQVESISMELAPDGFPFIVYKKSGNVRVAHCNSQSCTTADLNTVADTANDLGSRTSVGLLSAGSAMAIAFTDQTANNTKYLRCDNPTAATPCTSVTSTVVVGGDSFSSDIAGDDATSFMRLVVVGDGTPLVFTSAARYSSSAPTIANKCSTTDCSSVSSTTLTGTTVNAGIKDAAVGPDGFAAVVVAGSGVGGGGTGGPFFVRCNNAACTSSTNVALGYEPATFFIFYAASIAIPSSNNPVLLLTQDGNGNPSKRYYYICNNSSCSSGTLTDVGINEGEDDTTSSSTIAINSSGDAVGVLGRATSGTSRAIKIFLSSVLATGTDVGSSATRLANAYFSGDIKTGSLTIDGTGSGQGGFTTVGGVTIGDSSGSDSLTVNLGDNLSNAVDIQQGSDNYFNISTTNSAETIAFGNTTTNPKYTFLGSGNFGIGTATPSAFVHIRKDQTAVTRVNVENQNATAGSARAFTATDGTNDATWSWTNSQAALNLPSGDYALLQANGAIFDGLVLSNVQDQPIVFGNNATERMRIAAGGNIGIGDATPASLFTVGSGDLFQVDSSGRVFAPNGASGAGNLAYSFVNDTDTGLYRSATNEMRLQTSGADRITVDASGNVGVGTTAPLARMVVNGTGVSNEGLLGLEGTSSNIAFSTSGGTYKGFVGYENTVGHGSDADLNIKTGYNGASKIRFSVAGDTETMLLESLSSTNYLLRPSTTSSLVVSAVYTSLYGGVGAGGDNTNIARMVDTDKPTLFRKMESTGGNLNVSQCNGGGSADQCTSVSATITPVTGVYDFEVIERSNLAWFAYTTGGTDVVLVQCTNGTCSTTATPIVIDSSANAKYSVALALAPNNDHIGVVWAENTGGSNYDVKFRRCNNPSAGCSSLSAVQTLASFTSANPFAGLSLVIQNNTGADYPLAIYHDLVGNDDHLTALACSGGSDCSGGVTSTALNIASSDGSATDEFYAVRDFDGLTAFMSSNSTGTPAPSLRAWFIKCTTLTCSGFSQSALSSNFAFTGSQVDVGIHQRSDGYLDLFWNSSQQNIAYFRRCTSAGCAAFTDYDVYNASFEAGNRGPGSRVVGIAERPSGDIRIFGHFPPDTFGAIDLGINSPSTAGVNLGSSSYKFGDLYLVGDAVVRNVTASGIVRGVTGVTAGTSNSMNALDVGSEGAAIGSTYAGTIAAPTNGLIVEGNVGIGDSSPLALLTVGASDAFQVDSTGRVFANFGASGAGNLAYSFVGDTDTGLYRSATNEMRLQTNGADRVTIDASGNVGIGTTTPSELLSIRKDQNLGTYMNVQNATNGTAAVVGYTMTNGGGNVAAFDAYAPAHTFVTPGGIVLANMLSLATDTGYDGMVIRTLGADPILFGTTDTERMRITGSGNVGIGTASPTSRLTVGISTSTVEERIIVQSKVDAVLELSADTDDAGGENDNPYILLKQDTGGNNTHAVIGLEGDTADTAPNGETFVGAGKNNGLLIGNFGLDPIHMGVGAQTYFSMLGSSEIGIGTLAPSNPFQVSPIQYNTGTASQSGTTVTGSGTTFTSAMVGKLFTFNDGTTRTVTAFTDATHLEVTPSGTVASQGYRINHQGLNVASSGRVGIGTTSPTQRLEIVDTADVYLLLRANDTGSNGYSAYIQMDADGTGGGNGAGMELLLNGVVKGRIGEAGGGMTFQSLSTGIFEWQGTGGGNMWLANDGHLGIGDQFPTEARLVVGNAGAGDIYATFASSANTERLCWDGSGASLITDCSGSPGDYAEMYGTSDVTVAAGDIVQMDAARGAFGVIDDGVSTSKAFVVKAQSANSPLILGVVATQPNETIGQSIKANENPRPIALSGRVPVKVNTENGPIRIGDPITSSSTPGVGMRAVQNGMVVGYALSAFDGTGTGSVIVSVHTGWWNGAQIANPNQASGLTATQSTTLQIFGDLDFANYSINNIKSINSANWSISESGQLTAKRVVADEFAVRITDEKATIGQAQILSGQQSVFVTNASVTETSKVFITWRTSPGTFAVVSEIHAGSFTVALDVPALRDATFDYWIVNVEDARTPPPSTVQNPATAPTTTDPLPPAETTQLTEPATTTALTEPATTTTLTEPAQVIVQDPAPAPTVTPDPTPSPEPTPEPAPAPELVSEPTPVSPAPAIDPTPAPAPEPAP